MVSHQQAQLEGKRDKPLRVLDVIGPELEVKAQEEDETLRKIRTITCKPVDESSKNNSRKV